MRTKPYREPHGVHGPWGYHPPLPPDASRWRRGVRAVYEFWNDLLYAITPWL